MNSVSHSRCKKCNKIKLISDLKDNPDGVGMVCLDDVLCKKEQSKKQTRSGKY